MVRHGWCCDSWLDFSFVFGEEESLDSEAQKLITTQELDLWWRSNRPVEIHVVVDFCFSLLICNKTVQGWWHLLLQSTVDLRHNLVTNSSHEQSFEKRCKFYDDVAMKIQTDMILWKINAGTDNLDGWYDLTAGKSLLFNLDFEANRHVRDMSVE